MGRNPIVLFDSMYALKQAEEKLEPSTYLSLRKDKLKNNKNTYLQSKIQK